MQGPVYPDRLGRLDIERLIPPAGECERINEIIFTELVNHRFTDASRPWFAEVIGRLTGRGCDAVVLGCTESPRLIAAAIRAFVNVPVVVTRVSFSTLPATVLRSASLPVPKVVAIVISVDHTELSGESSITTHDAGGVTESDVRLAAEMNRLAEDD